MLEPRLCLKMLHLLTLRREDDRRRFAKCVCCPLRSSVHISFFYSLSYRNRLRKRKSDYVILDNHSFEPASSCCVKFILNESADTSLGQKQLMRAPHTRWTSRHPRRRTRRSGRKPASRNMRGLGTAQRKVPPN